MSQEHAGAHPASDTGHGAPGREEWIDRLVDLHVLTANGDDAARAEAERWLAEDGAARKVWDDVQRTCDQLMESRVTE